MRADDTRHPHDTGRHCINPDCRAHFEPSAPGQKFCDECSARLCKVCHNEVPFTTDDSACLTCVESREICGKCCEPKPRGEICEQCYPNAAAQNAIRRSFQQ